MAMGTRDPEQPPLWIAASDLPVSPGHPFYTRLNALIRLSPARSKTLVGRILPISPPIAEALARRRARRDPDSPLVFHRDGIPVRRWRTAWRTACQAAGVPTRFLHDCRRTAARNLTRASVPERVTMLLTGPQEPRHLRPLQHHPRAGTARGRGPACRLSGAARTGDTAWRAAPPGPHRRPAHRAAPSPRATHYRVRVHDDQRLLEQKMLRDHRSDATGATQPRGHDGQVKQGEQEGLHARDRVGQTSGATQRCLILESARELGIRDAQVIHG